MIEAEKSRPGQVLKYGFNHRYHDSVRDALAIAQGGELGRIINMRGVYGKSQFISYGQHSDWRTERAIARSLASLQTEYLDLYLIHACAHGTPPSPCDERKGYDGTARRPRRRAWE